MNVPLEPLAEGLPRRRFSVADVMRMAEVGLIGHDERLEVLDGDIVVMFPKGIEHESVKGALNMKWQRGSPEDSICCCVTGLYLAEHTYLQPDFMIFSRTIRYADLKGTDVLLAAEIADYSLDYDLNRKPSIYAAYGVRELWVIDAARREIHVHREPSAGGYASIATHRSHERLAPVRAPQAFALTLDELPRL